MAEFNRSGKILHGRDTRINVVTRVKFFRCQLHVGFIRIVRNVQIDECNRLWVVDTGRVMMTAVCPTKILIFDLATDRLIHKYLVPDDQVLYGKAALVTPIVDVGKTCLDTYLYVADVDQNGLVIYDLYRDHSWRVNNTRGNAFGPDEDAMNITIAGEWFDLTDGTLGMSLSPLGYFAHRYTRYDITYLVVNPKSSRLQKFRSNKNILSAFRRNLNQSRICHSEACRFQVSCFSRNSKVLFIQCNRILKPVHAFFSPMLIMLFLSGWTKRENHPSYLYDRSFSI